VKGILAVIISAMAAAISLTVLAVPAFALDPPDDKPTINSVRVFTDLAEPDDFLAIFHASISSTNGTFPDTPAYYAFLFRLYDEDGATLLSSARPFVFSLFDNNGYGEILSGFYFTADDAPAWHGNYIINIFGIPQYYNPPITSNYEITKGDYSTAETSEASREDLYNWVVGRSTVFKAAYPDVPLFSGAELSEYGERYVKGVIQGIDTLCPQLFYYQVYIPEVMDTDGYDTSLADTYGERLDGTDLKRGADRLGATINVSGVFVFGILTIAGCIGVCIYSVKKGWGVEAGILGGSIIAIAAAVLVGDALVTIVMIASLLATMGIMYIILHKKA